MFKELMESGLCRKDAEPQVGASFILFSPYLFVSLGVSSPAVLACGSSSSVGCREWSCEYQSTKK